MASDFALRLKEYASFVDAELDRALPVIDNKQKDIYEAMRYSLLAGGKRIRPVLTLVSAELLGVKRDDVIPFALALEMIHTYSLIHDDLPAMDNDDYRRGRLTCHKQFGEAQAILAGDALLTKAFEIASAAAYSSLASSDSSAPNTLSDITRGKAEAVYILAQCAGSEGMIGGQVIDLEAETRSINGDELEYLCSLKTGALLEAPARIALAIAGRGNEEIAELLRGYTRAIGLAFQIKDDILDVEGDMQTLGKAVGVDARENKTTFVSLYGLESSNARLAELTAKAIGNCNKMAEIEGTNRDASRFLKELAIFLLERNY